MKPGVFEYHRAVSIDDALDVLAEFGDDASVLAGGQSLVPLLNLRLARPSVLVDINGVRELDGLLIAPDAVSVGALTRARAIERSAEAAAALPVLREAISHIAHPQIRVRTTIGGNLAHADPSSELPAVLAAMDGRVELERRGSRRTLRAAEFFQEVFTTAREPDELVVSVVFPVLEGFQWRFVEVARRHGDYGMVSVCAGLHVRDGTVSDARIALAGCGPVPLRATVAEKALVGGAANAAQLARTAAAAVRDTIEPTSDIHGSGEYRRSLAGVLVSRAVESIVEAS